MATDPINVDAQTDALIEHILSVTDASNLNPYPAFSREDVVAIGVKMFELACMSPLMREEAVAVWHAARKSWFETKDGDNG